MVKFVFYCGFCLVVINVGHMLTGLVFANGTSLVNMSHDLTRVFLGIAFMACSWLIRMNKMHEDDLYCTILAIERVCDKECVEKIKEDAVKLNVLMHVDRELFKKEMEKTE